MKIFTGKVISVKSQKTAAVLVTRVTMHPMYLKRFKKERKYLVHDEIGVQVGEMVRFIATKPISKRKKWIILPENKETKVKKGEKI